MCKAQIYIHIYIYIYTHTERERERDAHRLMDVYKVYVECTPFRNSSWLSVEVELGLLGRRARTAEFGVLILAPAGSYIGFWPSRIQVS